MHIIPFSPVHSTAIDLFDLSSGSLTQIYLFYFYLIWFSKSTVICNLKWFCQIFKCCGSVCGWLVVDGNPPPPPLLNTKYSAGGAGGPIITIIIINITIIVICTIIKVHTLILLHYHHHPLLDLILINVNLLTLVAPPPEASNTPPYLPQV